MERRASGLGRCPALRLTVGRGHRRGPLSHGSSRRLRRAASAGLGQVPVRKPVLLILIGSDLSMMSALNRYDRPFHQRGTEMVIGPLNPAEISSMLGLDATSAFDAALVSGGLPLICGEWPRGATAWQYLEQALSNPVSALLVSGERSLAAEFPTEVQARDVLRAIGSGERTFTSINRAAGGINHASLTRALDRLTAKGIVSAELPVSLMPSRERRYRITDPYLRFWLR